MPEPNDPEDEILDRYFEREAEKEFDKWELSGYWNVLKEQENKPDLPNPKPQG